MIKRIIPYAKELISEVLSNQDIAIDCTCGNGHDTLFLANRSKHVYSYDIQEDALNNTRQLLQKHQVTNVTLLHESHDKLTQLNVSPKVIMYNLGYLPGTDKSITTLVETTLQSIKQGLDMLMPNGLMSITIYRGHEEGKKEEQVILSFASSLPPKEYTVLLYQMPNTKDSPFNLFIKKKR